MKKLLAVFCVCVACRCVAADGVSVFQSGLRAFQENGPNALLNAWYGLRDDRERIDAIRDRLSAISRYLGAVLDTEVFAPQSLGTHVQRLYGVIYFEKRPLWLRADFYEIGGRGGFIALEFSLVPDDVLPVARPGVP